jgi:hypothetical protein
MSGTSGYLCAQLERGVPFPPPSLRLAHWATPSPTRETT